jgi:hypothetical protein
MPVPDSKYKDTYSYHGPVFIFDKTVAHVKLKTQAVSLAKAYSNMVWQVKKELGYQPTAKVTISKENPKKKRHFLQIFLNYLPFGNSETYKIFTRFSGAT